MTGKEIAAALRDEPGTAILLNKATIKIGKQDRLAGQMLSLCYEQFGVHTIGEYMDALDAARWWLTMLASLDDEALSGVDPKPTLKELFPITRLSRADIAGLRYKGEPVYSEAFCNAIPDAVMERIAEKMADAYMSIYWIDLEIIAEQVLRDAGLSPEPTKDEGAL